MCTSMIVSARFAPPSRLVGPELAPAAPVTARPGSRIRAAGSCTRGRRRSRRVGRRPRRPGPVEAWDSVPDPSELDPPDGPPRPLPDSDEQGEGGRHRHERPHRACRDRRCVLSSVPLQTSPSPGSLGRDSVAFLWSSSSTAEPPHAVADGPEPTGPANASGVAFRGDGGGAIVGSVHRVPARGREARVSSRAPCESSSRACAPRPRIGGSPRTIRSSIPRRSLKRRLKSVIFRSARPATRRYDRLVGRSRQRWRPTSHPVWPKPRRRPRRLGVTTSDSSWRSASSRPRRPHRAAAPSWTEIPDALLLGVRGADARQHCLVEDRLRGYEGLVLPLLNGPEHR